METSSHKKGNKKKNKASGPSPQALVYKGSVKPPSSSNEASVYELYNAQTFTVASNAGGVLSGNYGSWPSGINDWSNVIGTFHEVRTLGMRLEYVPHNRYTRGTVTTTSVATVVDHTDAGALGSYDAAANHESGKIRSLDDPFVVTAKMTGSEEAQFQDATLTSSVANRFFIKLYADGLSFSTTYGRVTIYYLYQVRGRK